MKRYFAPRLAGIIVIIATLTPPSHAGIMAFDFVSTLGEKEAEIVLDLPASSVSSIRSLTLLPGNDFYPTNSPISFRPSSGSNVSSLAFVPSSAVLTTTSRLTVISGDALLSSGDTRSISLAFTPSAAFVDDIVVITPPSPTPVPIPYPNIDGDWELRATPVPEPHSLILCGSAALVAWGFRNRLRVPSGDGHAITSRQ